ncbi:ferredoxin--NADP reductase [Lactobacillus nasalidis]|uniref:Ferredoxin--NADP reductase n=1 Tax=Lactobacillus nasalidis TaxID=2797258 RepID=A0ABQ3W765_9LACO|nr:NAD(P)/FAD-dependent oxidoreductase [Lactobacillus nasalidis]GHV97232.1 ferredoxin--NADP reductase [Lactobacillus nasalidis]GHV99026.1 ferredoxin--NADP reductase [Lactobacillus nasalidis]GHW01918.1 ferredoxin--NADP reductase [Lactobacillus nasalidis]
MIGAGPVGLFAAYFARLHGLKTVILESLNEPGGQPEMLYPFKKILDIPVFQEITAADLTKRLLAGLTDQDLVTGHKVSKLTQDDGLVIDDEYQVRSIIIATGNGAFKAKKFPLKADGAAEDRIHYFFKNPQQFAGQKIGIFGGGDTALDWSQELADLAQVTLVHRRDQFRGMESSVDKLKASGKVTFRTPYLPKSLQLAGGQLKIGLKQVGGDEVREESFDQILVAYGFRADNRFVSKWGVELKQGLIDVDRAMQTSVAGIYAVGDACGYPGRVPIIGIGFGEAQIAVNAIMQDLFPEKSLTIHSTSI